MSIPKRHQIREALRIMLDGQTDAGSKVYSNRVTAYWRGELPCVSIFMRDEEATPREMAARSYIRKCNISVEIHAEAKENLDLDLDKIADQVETVIQADQSLSGTVQGTILTGTEIELSEQATTPIGVLTLTFQITYIK